MEKSMMIMWIVMTAVFIIAEAATAQLVSVWFVLGSIGALIGYFLGASPWVQVVIFIAVSALTLVLTRPLVKRFVKNKTQPTNVDALVGEDAVVTKEINNLLGEGEAKLDGKSWSARSADDTVIPAGSVVTVIKIEGVKLIVSQAEK